MSSCFRDGSPPSFKLSTPVALIIFNRPETTARVFDAIAKAKPTKLFVICDGPRKHRPDDLEKVEATRSIVNQVNWECEVFTKFSDENLGCKLGPANGISWVFEQVEEAIILEDDCFPDQTFFRFCQEMLAQYRNDQRISMISGDNFLFGRQHISDSYYFSKYCLTWGWATWRDKWLESYDITLSKWPTVRDQNLLPNMLGNAEEVAYWREIFERVHTRKLDTAWDYQWFFANLLAGRVTIVPAVNLISNVGVGVDATHTVNESLVFDVPSESLSFPLKHPIGVIKNIQADVLTDQVYFRLTFSVRIRNKILRLKKIITRRFGLK